MTLFFPDVSQYTPNVDVTPYPIVLARATLSASVADTSYLAYKQRSAGKVFVAYHWLNHGNLAAQAAWCFQHVGAGTPVMIDAEDVAGNTGYAGPLTVGDITGFAAEYRALGGIVSLCYLPAWYYFGPMGAPDLTALTAAGLHLVSSNYPPGGYTDNGPGWASYGGVAPVQWQYTSTPTDMNAFRGTVAEYAQLIGGGVLMALTDAQQEDLYRRVCNQDAFWYYGSVQGGETIPATELLYGDPPSSVHPAADQPFALMKRLDDVKTALAALGAPVGPTDAQVNAAVAAVMHDPAWLAQLGAALASHIHVA